ncbi:MAG: FHA domain-containing protein [Clostridia bacterium]|nr:FHA domain-containing protein [Clostridia bacterium]
MEKLLIIAAIVFFAAVIIKNLIGKKDPDNGNGKANNSEVINIKIPKKFDLKNGGSENRARRDNGKTIRFAEWTVYVLDKEGNIISEQAMSATSERPFSIGYDKDCDLVVNSNYVTGVHLKIGKDDQGYFAKDSSLNGTFVNDKMYNNESFSLEEGLVYVADVPVYFKKNSDNRPNVIPKFVKDNVEETSKTKKFDGFNNTRSWKKDAGESGANRPFTR